MTKNILSAILIIPVGIGGAFMWSTSAKTRRDKGIVAAIVAYDLLVLAVFHFWLKTF